MNRFSAVSLVNITAEHAPPSYKAALLSVLEAQKHHQGSGEAWSPDGFLEKSRLVQLFEASASLGAGGHRPQLLSPPPSQRVEGMMERKGRRVSHLPLSRLP